MKEKTIALTHGLLPYVDIGSGPVLLFLHGAIASPGAYEPLLTALSGSYRILAPTQPGHGNSFPISGAWEPEHFRDILREFLGAVASKPAVVIGHSFGGALALLISGTYPEARIVAMDPCGLPLPTSVAEYISYTIAEAGTIMRQKTGIRTVTGLLPPAKNLAYTVLHHPKDLAWIAEHIPAMDISGTIRTIANRVTLMWGEQDNITPVTIGYKMLKMLGNADMITYSDKGHGYPILDAEWTAGEILRVLSVP